MRRVRIGLLVFVLGLSVSLLAEEPEAILEKADAVRNPSESYFLKVAVENANEPDRKHVFRVAIKDDKTIIETVEPAGDRGRNLLMLGENMWAYIPNLKRAVRVALGQKLTGEAANGDLSRLRWSGDYETTITAESEAEWELHLQAKRKGLTYERIRVWIERGTYRPLRAQYLTGAGKILKHVTYQDYRELAGGIRPGEIHIQDAIRASDHSTIRILEMEVRTFANSLFRQTELGKQQIRE